MRAYLSPDAIDGFSDISPADPTGPRFRIEDIFPSVDGGRYPVKRIAGEPVSVWADIFREGHDVIAAALLWRLEGDETWQRDPMQLENNDRWLGQFTPPMAVNLMVVCRLADVRMEQTLPWVGWLVVWFGAAALAVLFVPELALWLPRSLGY